ncbi:YhcN/YlaJ family sporulation lipoprotein [Salicibibacter cibarius]|uniref:YhcN/YlaJ family sporulation lipoprotein n=1 Tax=Salicibibacter cibarius TaxID=2743000 RepID=A0A7T6Z3B0_9BACI|nr:YhcN/YlaJ family sporulation lipoprotein [Salicibibacter cibarius]QQK76081.1 YhcN/YlaJ family sporulation lipoprotein [Salicibibacter cibarius]
MKKKFLVLVMITIFVTSGCVQTQHETGHARQDYNPERELGINLHDHLGPASDLLVPDDGPGNLTEEGTQNIDSQRDYGWHENRANAVKIGRVNDHPRLNDDAESLRDQVQEINQQYEGEQEDLITIKEKIEMLEPVSNVYAISHDGRLYIGIEGASVDDEQLGRAISSLVSEEDIVWHTDRRAVNRIRAAEKTMDPNGEFGAHDWLENVEYELQKLGDDWTH